jgi:plasmid stabilization system protein ParE
MNLITLGEAEREFAESIAYYEGQETGLGGRFRDEVVAAIDRIVSDPELPRFRAKGYRRVNLRVFPHYIAYVIREQTIWIVAIAHGFRRPEFWIERI